MDYRKAKDRLLSVAVVEADCVWRTTAKWAADLQLWVNRVILGALARCRLYLQ
jgi:hypothetical protein